MVYTLKIDDSNAKANALLIYLKTLDFVDVEEIEHEDFVLTEEHLKIVNETRQNHLSGRSKSYSWEELVHNARKSR